MAKRGSWDNNRFAVRWIKRCPTGIIASNILDANEMVASIMEYIDGTQQNGYAIEEEVDGDDSSKGRRGLIRHLELIEPKGILKITICQT